MNAQFYYSDANAQPVGPLSLDEIRRFAMAGVVPEDVMICEAGDEDWKPLTGFAEPPRTAPPPKSAPPPAIAGLEPNREDSARKLSFHLDHAILVMAISVGVDLASGASGSSGTTPEASPSFFAGLLNLWVVAAEVVLIYKLVCALPPHLRFTSPGKAAGFTLIPGFHLYWAFRLLPGLAEAVHQWESESPGVARKPVPRWLIPLAYTVAALIAVSTAFSLRDWVGGVPVSVGTRLVYAIVYGGLIAFYSTVTNAIRRFILPNETEKENRESWGSMIWTCIMVIYVISKLLQYMGVIDS